jgi:glycosyltransferase involved in cell wall biosynthesis
MRIVAVVGVKDEVELIERAIAHLRTIGVDEIVVCDMESTDGTTDVLLDHATGDGFRFTQMSDQISQEAWSSRILGLVREAGADWATFLDADEYVIPAGGSLRDYLAAESSDVLIVDRLNVPLQPNGPALPDKIVPGRYEEVQLIAEPLANVWTDVENQPDASWIRSQIQSIRIGSDAPNQRGF